jgi:hypothetical protein
MDKKTEQKIKDDLEKKVNGAIPEIMKKDMNDAGKAFVDTMNAGAKEFEKKIGRPMTYAEMRAMWG